MIRHLWIALGFFSAFVLSAHVANAGDKPAIDAARLERLLTQISADDMKGRYAGSEGERKAAAVIAKEFEKAGLKPFFDGSFLQKFEMTRVSRASNQLVINGKTIDPNDYVISTEKESVSSSSLEEWLVETIQSPVQLGQVFGAVMSGAVKQPTLIVADPAMAPRLRLFFPHLKKPTFTLEPDQGKLLVLVISDITEVNSVDVQVKNTVEPVEMANVVGVLPGTEKVDEYVMFSAHYDHIGELEPVNGDAIANGANDDGTGTVAVMELAHYFGALGAQKRGLLFAAFTAEELGGFGSMHMSSKVNPDQIVAGVNIEMIGKPSPDGPGKGFITGFQMSTLPQIMSEALAGTDYGMVADPYPSQNLFMRSDNYKFAKLGVPAHTVSSGEIDKDNHYHTVDDEIETLDMAHYHKIVEAIAIASKSLVSGEKTPTRIDPKVFDFGH